MCSSHTVARFTIPVFKFGFNFWKCTCVSLSRRTVFQRRWPSHNIESLLYLIVLHIGKSNNIAFRKSYIVFLKRKVLSVVQCFVYFWRLHAKVLRFSYTNLRSFTYFFQFPLYQKCHITLQYK